MADLQRRGYGVFADGTPPCAVGSPQSIGASQNGAVTQDAPPPLPSSQPATPVDPGATERGPDDAQATATDPSAETPGPPSRRRHTYTVGDMVRSLGLIVVIAGVVLLLGPGRRMVFPGDQAHPVPHASFSGNARAVARIAGHGFLSPAGLPGGWQATSARNSAADVHPTTLHIGFVTPDHEYAGLEESTGPAEPFLAAKLGSGAEHRRGTVDIGGRTWQRRTNAKGERALTRRAGGVTTIVVGSAGRTELRTLAGSLHPVAPPAR